MHGSVCGLQNDVSAFDFDEGGVYLAASDVNKVLLAREGAHELLLAALKASGLRVIMATGDNERTAKAVAAKLGIDEVRAGVLPEDKKALIDELRAQGRKIALGDDGFEVGAGGRAAHAPPRVAAKKQEAANPRDPRHPRPQPGHDARLRQDAPGDRQFAQ